MKKIIILLLGVVILSCNSPTNDPLKQNDFNDDIEFNDYKLNKVVLTGKTDDSLAFKYLNVMNNSYLFGRSHLDTTIKIFPDSIFMVLNSIEKPLLMEVASFTNKNIYRGNIFAVPGDTIHIEIKEGKMKFLGKNAIYNNYYSEMNMKTPKYSKNPYLGNLNFYKENVDSIYNERIVFLNNYIKKYNIQSKYFINTVKSDLRNEYLFTLMNPKITKARFADFYMSEMDALNGLIQKETYNHPERIIDLSNYFGSISIEEFKDLNNLNNSLFFKDNINAFIRYYFLGSKYLEYSKEKLLEEKKFIQNNFEGETETYAIARMIRDYHLKGFSYSIQNIDFMNDLIKEYEDKFTNPTYIEYMNLIKEDLESYDFKLSESALDTKFVNYIGDTLSLRKIFARSSKRIKVVDFWASWCPPCVQQIKEGKAFKDRLLVENNVEWIYLSVDKDYQQWLNKNKEFEHVLNFSNSFFILNGHKSSLASSLKVNGIPRYVIFNQKNKIVLNTAPSPSDSEYFERIIDGIND